MKGSLISEGVLTLVPLPKKVLNLKPSAESLNYPTLFSKIVKWAGCIFNRICFKKIVISDQGACHLYLGVVDIWDSFFKWQHELSPIVINLKNQNILCTAKIFLFGICKKTSKMNNLIENNLHQQKRKKMTSSSQIFSHDVTAAFC